MKIVLATENEGKLKEIQLFFKDLPITLVSQAEFKVTSIEETGLSFIENALIKARHAAKQSGCPALADDSGLVVDALDGQPGIYSARYAGTHGNSQDNINKLLAEMQHIEKAQRQAHFYCVLAFVRHSLDPAPLICQGRWDGRILTAPQGQGGFGYDPIFYLEQQQCSAAELNPIEKNKLSHRAKALMQFYEQFQTLINVKQL